jgi:pimeloyl-ACP methyl ester carboxylesterase
LCEGLVAEGFRVVRFDNRDIGLSEKLDSAGRVNAAEAFGKAMAGQKVEAPYLLDDMAGDAVGLLDALDIREAHVVGASMGGMIAQIMAFRYASRVRSLTSIMSTTSRPGLPPGKPEAGAALMTPPSDTERETRIAHGMMVWRAIGSQPIYASDDVELRDLMERAVDRAPYHPQGVARQLVAILASEPRHERLKSVVCPALVLHGEDDPLVNVEGGRDTAACIPGARLVIVPGMGHDFTSKLVPVFLREIGGFVSDVETRRKAA